MAINKSYVIVLFGNRWKESFDEFMLRQYQNLCQTFSFHVNVYKVVTAEGKMFLRYKGFYFTKVSTSHSRWRCVSTKTCYVALNVNPDYSLKREPKMHLHNPQFLSRLSNGKYMFISNLDRYERRVRNSGGSHKRARTSEKLLEVTIEINKPQAAIDNYWMDKYDMTTAIEDDVGHQKFMKNNTTNECSDNNIVNLAVTDSSNLIFKENFYQKLIEYDEQHQGSYRKAWTSERILEVINDMKKAQMAMSSGQRRMPRDYYWMGKYDIMTTANEDYLIFKRLTETAPAVRILPREQYYDILLNVHISCGHGGRNKTLHGIRDKYYYIPKKAVEIFVSLCPTCETKRNAPKKSL